MNSKELSQSIQSDIDKRTYTLLPKLRERLQFIGDKLIKSFYCGNVELSEGELKTLRENEYIE